MTDYSELQRAAEAVKAMDYPWEHTIRDGRLGKTSTQYARLAHPSNVLALIAENKRLAELLECAQGDCRQSMQIIEKLTPQAELYQQVERAAGELQNGWEIRICVERDAGYAELWDQDGCQVDFPHSCETLALTVSDAIDHATSKEPSHG